MDNATLIATAIGGILSGGFVTAIGAVFVSIRKSRTDAGIAEMNARTEDELKREKSAIEEWGNIHERDEVQIKELKAEVVELRNRVDEMQRREAECEKRCARMEEQLSLFKQLLQERGVKFENKSP